MGGKHKRKLGGEVKKPNNTDDVEMLYEKKARIVEEDEKQAKALLPIKLHDGTFVPQFMELADDDAGMEWDEEQEVEESTNVYEEKPKMKFPKSVAEIVRRRKEIIAEKKAVMAGLAAKILESPETSLKQLKDLRLMVEDHDSPECCATIRKLAVASTTRVFIDIIPDFRIRERTEAENQVKLTKEVKQRVDYDEGLLRHYQAFLKSLEKLIRHRNKSGETRMLSIAAQKSLGAVAIKSISELYTATSHFNFHNNIAVLLINCAHSDHDLEVRQLCCNAIRELFRKDKKGLPTLETVKNIAKICKDSPIHKTGPEFLDALLSLRINRVDYSMLPHPKNKEERRKIKDEKKRLSKRDRKKRKKQEALKNELKEVAASEDLDERTKFHTETISQLFWIYFRILKMKAGNAKHLLASVLRGLSDFAHLINIEFFSDLLKVLQELVSSANLSTKESLHCISAAFKILSGQGEVLNIDPVEFYNLTHKLLYDITVVTQTRECEEDVKILIDCLEVMMNKRRKQITLTCLCAFVKRLVATSLQLNSTKAALILLGEARKLMTISSKSDSLFHTESQDIGTYNEEENDPQHSGSTSAVLWDLHLLRRHYVPAINQSAKRFLAEGKRKIINE